MSKFIWPRRELKSCYSQSFDNFLTHPEANKWRIQVAAKVTWRILCVFLEFLLILVFISLVVFVSVNDPTEKK